jgi:RimJ/RimL family protein N-acetyltransferase
MTPFLVPTYSFTLEHATYLYDYLFNQESDKVSVERFLIIPFEKSLENFKEKMYNKNFERIFFIFEGETVIGYCSFFPYRYTKDWKWTNDIEMGIFIKSEYRGQGIGESVLKHLENDYINPFIPEFGEKSRSGKKLILAPTFNNPSVKLYERLGFKKVDDKQYNNDGLFRMEKIMN